MPYINVIIKDFDIWIIKMQVHLAIRVLAVCIMVSVYVLNSEKVHAQPILTIIAPKEGITVSPGDVISITVTSADPNVRQVFVVPDPPLPPVPPVSGTGTFTTSITIPTKISSGIFKIAAVAVDTNGQEIIDIVNILVAPNESIQAIEFSVLGLRFQHAGLTESLNIIGITPEDTRIDITNAENVSFTSQDTDVATVSIDGLVTAVESGTTTITASYINNDMSVVSNTIPISVLSPAIKGDLDGNGQVNIDDINILSRVLGLSLVTQSDPRDLNQDGNINETDVEILTTLCTYPNCSTHP